MFISLLFTQYSKVMLFAPSFTFVSSISRFIILCSTQCRRTCSTVSCNPQCLHNPLGCFLIFYKFQFKAVCPILNLIITEYPRLFNPVSLFHIPTSLWILLYIIVCPTLSQMFCHDFIKAFLIIDFASVLLMLCQFLYYPCSMRF